MDLIPSMNKDHVNIGKVSNLFCFTRNLQSFETRKITWRFICTSKITATRSKVLSYENIASTFS